jgi:glycerol-3-phosphate dehydrogenase (NAD(P)+)
MKVAVLGTGAWGRAFGAGLERNGHDVAFISRQDSVIPDGVEMIFVAVPAQAVRSRLQSLALPQVPLISLAKGIEISTGLRVTQIMQQVAPGRAVGSVSGPGLAGEVSMGKPTVLVVATDDPAVTETVQKIVHSKYLRTYRSSDVPGVEFGGALKNIFAIGAGVCAGLRIGENAMAGLVTRSLAEMVRIGLAGGSKMETLFGLSGLGDLMLTAYSESSRNHKVGVALAEGRGLNEILETLGGVAEGVYTTRAIYQLTEERKIKAPIVRETFQVLFETKSPVTAMHDLLTRNVDAE